MVTITLKTLKELESEEYSSLQFINEEIKDHRRAKEYDRVKNCEDVLRFQHGRWSMLCDLIDMIGEDNE